MLKRCSRCGETKPLDEFAANQATKARHNPSRAERRREHLQENNRRLIEYLRSHPCVDCGETDIVVLDFDHQRDKTMDINKMRSYAWTRVLAEIEKCEVVCANDHRRRTAAAQGWARALLGASAAS
ncbi:hypothetical protein K1W54_21885 [Micromonospora sp. CPCC 205371]|nr:hypothetical protein [Micromonospora sp. CPCC 205371]